MEKALFILFAAIALATAVSVVAHRNPLYGALSLIGTLAALSCTYIMLHAQFIAAIQIIVYAGAIMVLFLFVIMLLNLPAHEVGAPDMHKWLKYLALPFALAMGVETYFVLSHVPSIQFPATNGATSPVGTTLSIGVGLFTDYLLPFEVTSVLILMAVVGAMVLARREGD